MGELEDKGKRLVIPREEFLQNFGGREEGYDDVDYMKAILVSSWCRVEKNSETEERAKLMHSRLISTISKSTASRNRSQSRKK